VATPAQNERYWPYTDAKRDAAGILSMFGFWGFPSFDSTNVKGGIPYPGQGEKAQWGHAMVAVGTVTDGCLTIM
jgi:C1A family cysteine protease